MSDVGVRNWDKVPKRQVSLDDDSVSSLTAVEQSGYITQEDLLIEICNQLKIIATHLAKITDEDIEVEECT